jgi:transcriptional regulator with XRE-family HTH domain
MTKEKDIQIGERLKAARQAAGYETSREFCSFVGVNESTYSQHESGLRFPRDQLIKQYAEALQVNYEWLKFGKGAPISNPNSKYGEQLTKQLRHENVLTQSLVNTALEKELLTHIIEALLESIAESNFELAPSQMAEAITTLYNNIQKNESKPELRQQFVNVAVSTYMAVLSAKSN